MLISSPKVVRATTGPATAPSGAPRISITTARSQIALMIGPDQRLYQLGYGSINKTFPEPAKINRLDEFHPASGDGFICEPAIQAFHSDGNTSTDLAYVRHTMEEVDSNVSITRIELKDRAYPFFVTLCLKTYKNEDLIEQWTEIRNSEPRPVTLFRFASAAPVLKAKEYWLTQFQGDYKREATLVEEKLTPGIKVLDSKIGVRTSRFRIPSFLVSLDEKATEESGEVIGGSLEWSGSFQLAFEVDQNNRLRSLAGINPFGSQYKLEPGKLFSTPAVLWTYSDNGKGDISRKFHRWAHKYGIRDGDKPRPVLLNNWEATHMDFDENKIISLFDGAREIGAELFLLDDGWFGNKHPRDNDKAGLGDWQTNQKKIPHGLSHLAEEAKKRGIAFGIWVEPEMVNPASDLFEKHPDWAIQQPNRELELSRTQLCLDLARPEVREHAWKSIDDTLSQSGITYVKWDANRYVTQPGSPYLGPDVQSHVLTDYGFALYDLMDRMAKTFPNTMAMACAGGGGRTDYGTLKYFHSFWPSDNTDPRSRVFIQWGFGHFFPACTISAHVTRMGKRPTKFTCDVALSGAYGVDMDVAKMSSEEKTTIASATKLYKERLRDIVLKGDLYRLESPYAKPRAALNYVSADQSKAVLFVYQIADGSAAAVKPRGLDPKRTYLVSEAVHAGTPASGMAENNKLIDGATLMRDGINPVCSKEFDSAVIELSEAPVQ